MCNSHSRSLAPATERPALGLLLALLLGAWAASGPAHALPSDGSQPIRISADAAEIDEQQGVAIYTGSVELAQGTLLVTAERMTIYTKDSEVTRVTAEGDLAHYQQQQEKDASLVKADAKVITYYTQEQRVELSGEARLEQNRDSFRGDFIRYDISRKLVDASSAPAGSSSEPGSGRIEMVINPKAKDAN